MDKTPILIHPGEVARTAGDGIDEESLSNKIIDLKLRSLNNLIKVNGNNEVYTDLQLDDNLLSTATLPVGVTTGRVLQANGRPVTGTLILAKTTSGDNVKILYGDDGEIRVDNGTGVWKNITTAYFKTQAEYDALPQSKESDNNLYIIVDNHNEGVTVQFRSTNENWGTVSPSSITVPLGTPIEVSNNVLHIGSYTITATTTDFVGWYYIPQSGRVELVMDPITAHYERIQ